MPMFRQAGRLYCHESRRAGLVERQEYYRGIIADVERVVRGQQDNRRNDGFLFSL